MNLVASYEHALRITLKLFQNALVLYHLTSVGTCGTNWNMFDLFNISIT